MVGRWVPTALERKQSLLTRLKTTPPRHPRPPPRGGESSLDISADLTELGRTPVAVVCAGAKSVLDIPRTLEFLETQGVPVAGYGTGERDTPLSTCLYAWIYCIEPVLPPIRPPTHRCTLSRPAISLRRGAGVLHAPQRVPRALQGGHAAAVSPARGLDRGLERFGVCSFVAPTNQPTNQPSNQPTNQPGPPPWSRPPST